MHTDKKKEVREKIHHDFRQKVAIDAGTSKSHPKICINYRKHWKSYVSFQLLEQIGLIWVVAQNILSIRNCSPNWRQFPQQKTIFHINSQQDTQTRKSWGHPLETQKVSWF